jgi:hypothetical protein
MNPNTSQAQLNANRENAQHSTGPKTAAGRAVSSLNAPKTGLTGVTVLLPSDDAAAYQFHILSYEKQFNPLGPEETALVQSIADIRWRLNRIPALEIALIQIAHKELAATNEEFNRPDLTPVLEMEIRRAYIKDFRNLHLQENRLARRREKEMAELRAMQAERQSKEQADFKKAANLFHNAAGNKQPFNLRDFGFEFSIERFNLFMKVNGMRLQYQEPLATEVKTTEATA